MVLCLNAIQKSFPNPANVGQQNWTRGTCSATLESAEGFVKSKQHLDS